MFFPIARPARFSLGVSVAAYVVGTMLAGIVTAHGFYRVAQAVVAEVAPAQHAARGVPRVDLRPAHQQVATAGNIAERGQHVARQAAMLPTQDRWSRSERGWPAPRATPPPSFGSSSRVASHWPGNVGPRRDGDDDDDRPAREGSTFRTMCVRLCDGFYWPISFSTTEERFERDAQVCGQSCGGQARLFVYRNPGSDIEDMQDLQGRPYRRLSTAFLHRTQYVPACKCQPHPWEVESIDRHRIYALAAAKSKGNRQAAREFDELQKKVKQTAQQAAQQAGKNAGKTKAALAPNAQGVMAPNAAQARPAADPRAAAAAGEGQRLMGLGVNGARKSRPAPGFEGSRYDRNSDWMRRVFQPN